MPGMNARQTSAEAMLTSAFETMLFGRVVAEDLAALSTESRHAIAASALERFSKREAGKADIRLTDTVTADGTPLTILEAVNDDMPFLLASTLAELNDQGLDVRLVAHPVLAVKRNTGGEITALGGIAGAADTGDFSRESLIHIHLATIADQALRDRLVATLQRIYTDVQLAVRDWKAMRERLAEVARRYRENPPMLPADEIAEAVQFLDWLLADNFAFLGLREYRFPDLDGDPVPGEGLGILSDPEVKVLRRGSDFVVMTPEIRAFLKEHSALIIAKANVRSTIHRRVHMDYIGVKLIGTNGRLEGEMRLVGLFTSTAYTVSTRAIPYIRHKVAQVMQKAGFDPTSHSGKALMNVLENYPRDELFQLDRDTLYRFSMDAMGLIERPRVRALVRADRFDRFVSILVFVPKDRYDTSVRIRIGEFLAHTFEGRVSAAIPYYPEGPLVRTHFIIGRDQGTTPKVEQDAVEAGIADIIRTWSDKLRSTLHALPVADGGALLASRYADAFGAAYREAFTTDEALSDIRIIDGLSRAHPHAIDAYHKQGDQGARVSLKVFAYGQSLTLSRRVPMLENLGFTVNNERTYRILPAGEDPTPVFIHDMTIERTRGGEIDVAAFEGRLEAALMALLDGETESDRFNALVTEADLTWREAMVFRAYALYLRQIGAPFGHDYIADVLAKYPALTGQLKALFNARFAPPVTDDRAGRQAAGETIAAGIETALEAVSNIDEDRIFRRYLNLIRSTLRTNVYQTDADGSHRPAMAFKFDARAVDALPLPRPAYEISVHSPRVDGVHMRFGKVARGGLRWSDRPMDFRTEILGLVKAQQVKNAVIVPVGAKGGFVPKRLPPPGDRDAWMKEGTESYKVFIDALLDLTDNIDGTAIIPPPAVVRLDPDDPYLVVAADKGTATFSDTANSISLDRHFWLGDAFASGGSQGYDHKKMGITARGAWECVKRHFREIDIDIQTTPFTVAGVGDMSGDVFGNGMLLSPAIRLVAAFDHRDIFLDPAPDIAKALAERQRLFNLPRSSWQDYDKALISKGGGIYPRSAKDIPLSPEVRAVLGLAVERATPQEVMTAILKAKVDLLWFGGIGTYIRATTETDAQAGDRANDAIRITGADLNCRIIGEGANLGCTQRGRIEAAQHGVRLNTDAIDNSAGVNTSDVEVNLKIALARPVADKRLTDKDRNSLLADMTGDVTSLVLRNNYLQSLAISLVERRGAASLGELQSQMQALEARGRLDRAVEYLPSNAEIARRMAAGQGATRPEIAVLLAYAKLTFFDDLLTSKVPDDPYFADELDRYFPQKLRDRFGGDVKAHRLRRDIIATQLSNIVINRCGPAAIAQLAELTGRDAPEIAAAYALTRDSFRLLDLNNAIDALDTKIPGALQLDLYARVQETLLARMEWFLRNVDLSGALSPHVERFARGVEAARATLSPAKAPDLEAAGVPKPLATALASLPALAAVQDAVLLAERAGTSIEQALQTLGSLSDRLGVARIHEAARQIDSPDRFDRLAIERALDSGDVALREIAATVIARHGTGAAGVEAYATARAEALARNNLALVDLLTGPLTPSRVTIAASLIGDLARQ